MLGFVLCAVMLQLLAAAVAALSGFQRLFKQALRLHDGRGFFLRQQDVRGGTTSGEEEKLQTGRLVRLHSQAPSLFLFTLTVRPINTELLVSSETGGKMINDNKVRKMKRRCTHSSSSRASCAAEMRACGFLSLHAFCITAANQTGTKRQRRQVRGGSREPPAHTHQDAARCVRAFAYWRLQAGGGPSRR